MHVRTVALLLVGVLAAGCFGGGGGASKDDVPTTSSSGTTTASGSTLAGFSWTPSVPRAGDSVTFTGTVTNLGKHSVEKWSWTWGDGKTGSQSPTTHTFATAGDWTVRLNAVLSDGRTVTQSRNVFVLNVGEEVPGGNGTGTAPPPPPPGVFQCGATSVIEPYETHGTDDTLPALTWMTLKTGFRFAVAWSSEQSTVGSITYTLANGTPQTVTETVPSRVHLFVLDNVVENRTLCFTASMGGVTTSMHAVRTVNAMTAFRAGAPHGAYTVNILVLVNEQGDLAEVEEGLVDYADRLWDATDGWVRAGASLVIYNDPTRHNAGWVTCYIITFGPPACNQIYDVLFTNDAAPQGAASTYRKGVRDREAAVWMNQYHQAFPGPLSLDDTGAVLVHEMGHYLFDMDDLYGDPVAPDAQECDLPSLSMSIMGGPRSATEFDDEVNRCPTQPNSYVPSWTLMRGEFTHIADRTTPPLGGPDGNGGLFLSRTYRGA